MHVNTRADIQRLEPKLVTMLLRLRVSTIEIKFVKHGFHASSGLLAVRTCNFSTITSRLVRWGCGKNMKFLTTVTGGWHKLGSSVIWHGRKKRWERLQNEVCAIIFWHEPVVYVTRLAMHSGRRDRQSKKSSKEKRGSSFSIDRRCVRKIGSRV